jgi:hypothetical protein
MAPTAALTSWRDGRTFVSLKMMTFAPFLLALALAAPAAAAPTALAPTPAELSQAIARLQGAEPRLSNVHCQPSSRHFVRCTYLQWGAQGYRRWAVLVSPRAGRWTVSEGPIREKPRAVPRS